MTEKVKVCPIVGLIYTAKFVTLSGDQNEVYLVLQSLLLTAYFRKSNDQKIFFLLQYLTFYGLIIVYTKAFFALEKADIPPYRPLKVKQICLPPYRIFKSCTKHGRPNQS